MQHIHQAILDWYQLHGRKTLPWRNVDTAYPIYVSEIMLQQTQVNTVLDRFYYPFLKQFPTLSHLANASTKDILKQWEGLGYYNRALNMHKAANQCNGTLPQDPKALITLPGIGKNTAHAIMAFAYHKPFPILEANAKRVITRIFALTSPSEKILWTYAEQLLDRKNPYSYNQAMMDIGSLICTKTSPQCSICPFAPICKGKSSPLTFPSTKRKKPPPIQKYNIIVFRYHDLLYLNMRTTRFLQGLYGFTQYQPHHSIIFNNETLHLRDLNPLGNIRQNYSHFTLEAKVYEHHLTTLPAMNGWYQKAEIAKLPLSKADHKILALL